MSFTRAALAVGSCLRRQPLAVRADPHPSDEHRRLTGVIVTGIVVAVLMGRWGLPPVNLHSPLHRLGMMDPLCGMTRAAAALGRGDLATAWRYNPGVFVLGAAAAGALLRVGVAAATGTWWWVRAQGWLIWLVPVSGLVALQINQQLHAGLLR